MYSFADNSIDDQDIAIFTKRLDTLLVSANDFGQEAERLPASLELLSRDEHLTADFRAALVRAIDSMRKSSTETLQKEIKLAKEYLKRLNENLSGPADVSGFTSASGTQHRQRVYDRDQQAELVAKLEKDRKQKEKFPVRFTFQSFTDALEASGLFPEFYIQCLKNGFETSSTLRRILQSLLALWGFEHQFTF